MRGRASRRPVDGIRSPESWHPTFRRLRRVKGSQRSRVGPDRRPASQRRRPDRGAWGAPLRGPLSPNPSTAAVWAARPGVPQPGQPRRRSRSQSRSRSRVGVGGGRTGSDSVVTGAHETIDPYTLESSKEGSPQRLEPSALLSLRLPIRSRMTRAITPANAMATKSQHSHLGAAIRKQLK